MSHKVKQMRNATDKDGDFTVSVRKDQKDLQTSTGFDWYNSQWYQKLKFFIYQIFVHTFWGIALNTVKPPLFGHLHKLSSHLNFMANFSDFVCRYLMGIMLWKMFTRNEIWIEIIC